MKFQNFILLPGLLAVIALLFLKALPAWSDAKIPGTPYHARGDVPCSVGSGKKQSCPFGVIRQCSNGNGTVVIIKPDGRQRSIFFEKGKAIGYDQNPNQPAKFSATKQGDLNQVHIGQEHYEIPDAVIFGG